MPGNVPGMQTSGSLPEPRVQLMMKAFVRGGPTGKQGQFPAIYRMSISGIVQEPLELHKHWQH